MGSSETTKYIVLGVNGKNAQVLYEGDIDSSTAIYATYVFDNNHCINGVGFKKISIARVLDEDNYMEDTGL